MLGRLSMTIDECLDEYIILFKKLAAKAQEAKTNSGNEGQTVTQLDSAVLRKVIVELVERRGYKVDSVFYDESIRCKR